MSSCKLHIPVVDLASLDDELPDLAEIFKTYTAQIASLKPIPSSSKVLTAKTFDGSTVFLTRKPRRRESVSPV